MYVRTGYDIIALANKTSTLWLFQDFGHFLAFFYVDFLVHLGRCLHLGLRFLWTDMLFLVLVLFGCKIGRFFLILIQTSSSAASDQVYTDFFSIFDIRSLGMERNNWNRCCCCIFLLRLFFLFYFLWLRLLSFILFFEWNLKLLRRNIEVQRRALVQTDTSCRGMFFKNFKVR